MTAWTLQRQGGRRPFYSNLTSPSDFFSIPAVLRACLASQQPYSYFMRSAVSSAAIGQRAWVRKRHVVLAHVWAPEED